METPDPRLRVVRSRDEGGVDEASEVEGDAARIELPAILRGSPREVLMRVIDGDPLGLAGRVEERARHHALLVDRERVAEAAQARVAFGAGRLREAGCFAVGQDLAGFVTGCVDWALREVLNEDIEDERRGLPEVPPWNPAHEFLTRTLGIEAASTRKATSIFNHLAWATRRAFCAVMVEGKTLHRWVAEGHGPPERAKARIEHALIMLSTLGQHPGPGPDRDLPQWEPSPPWEQNGEASQEHDA